MDHGKKKYLKQYLRHPKRQLSAEIQPSPPILLLSASAQPVWIFLQCHMQVVVEVMDPITQCRKHRLQ